MQFTNIEEMERDFRNIQHLYKLLNYMVSSIGFPHPDFYVGGGGRRYINLLTKIYETNLTERSSTMRTNTWRF